jgi:hypothetical protein
MALIVRNPDGTYASQCALCGSPLSDPVFATSHFIGDQTHDLYRFSDAAMHWDCYARWPHQARFASMFFEAALSRSERNPWPQYWAVLSKSSDALVLYGLAINEVSVVLRKSGTDIRIPRECWQDWLRGQWRDDCRHPLECDAVADMVAEFERLALPQPNAAPNSSPLVQFLSSSEVQTPDSQRTPSSGGCG